MKASLRTKSPTRLARTYKHQKKSRGGRGVEPDATPSLPTNARQSLPIRLFAGVCRFGVNFGPGPRSLAPRHFGPITIENPMKQGVAECRLPFRRPAPSRHPFGPALTALSKCPRRTQSPGSETGRPRCHISDRCQTQRTNRARCWSAESAALISRWCSACRSTRCAGGRPSALEHPACGPGGRFITVAPPSKSGWKSRNKPPRAAAVQEGVGDGQAKAQIRLAR